MCLTRWVAQWAPVMAAKRLMIVNRAPFSCSLVAVLDGSSKGSAVCNNDRFEAEGATRGVTIDKWSLYTTHVSLQLLKSPLWRRCVDC